MLSSLSESQVEHDLLIRMLQEICSGSAAVCGCSKVLSKYFSDVFLDKKKFNVVASSDFLMSFNYI